MTRGPSKSKGKRIVGTVQTPGKTRPLPTKSTRGPLQGKVGKGFKPGKAARVRGTVRPTVAVGTTRRNPSGMRKRSR